MASASKWLRRRLWVATGDGGRSAWRVWQNQVRDEVAAEHLNEVGERNLLAVVDVLIRCPGFRSDSMTTIPTWRTIMRRTGLRKTAVDKWLRWLFDRGFLVRVAGGQNAGWQSGKFGETNGGGLAACYLLTTPYAPMVQRQKQTQKKPIVQASNSAEPSDFLNRFNYNPRAVNGSTDAESLRDTDFLAPSGSAGRGNEPDGCPSGHPDSGESKGRGALSRKDSTINRIKRILGELSPDFLAESDGWLWHVFKVPVRAGATDRDLITMQRFDPSEQPWPRRPKNVRPAVWARHKNDQWAGHLLPSVRRAQERAARRARQTEEQARDQLVKTRIAADKAAAKKVGLTLRQQSLQRLAANKESNENENQQQ